MNGSLRTRLAARLTGRGAAACEIVLILFFTIGHRGLHIIPVDETILILVLGCISLWLRGLGFKGVGFRRPQRWRNAIGTGFAVGVALQILSEFVTEPLIERLTHEPVNNAEFLPLVGNVKLLAVYLILIWTWAAFGEEFTYRGYVLNRAAELFGPGRASWIIGLIFTTLLFGIGHSYQGIAGMIDTGIHGFILGAVYLASRRNLWPGIIAHGVTDTVAIVMVFTGHL